MGLGDPRGAALSCDPGAAARPTWERARPGENKKVPPARSAHVGAGRGLGRRGSRALTSDPGSSPRSPGAARPLFTQDPSRGPCSCRARALLNPAVPGSVPSPRRQPRGRILRRGTPAPPPPPPRRPGPGGRREAAGAGRAERLPGASRPARGGGDRREGERRPGPLAG